MRASGARAIVVRADLGGDGAERERELLAICRATGMRLVGPASFGVLTTDPARPLNLTPASMPAPGRVGIATQSGEVGRELLALAAERGLGVSSFASLGGRLDLTANDLLEFWEEDEATNVVLLHVESFSDPRRFARVARRVGRQADRRRHRAPRRGAGRPRPLRAGRGDPRQSPAEMLDLAMALSGRPPAAGADIARVLAKVDDHAELLRHGPIVLSAPPGARPDEAAAILGSPAIRAALGDGADRAPLERTLEGARRGSGRARRDRRARTRPARRPADRRRRGGRRPGRGAPAAPPTTVAAHLGLSPATHIRVCGIARMCAGAGCGSMVT